MSRQVFVNNVVVQSHIGRLRNGVAPLVREAEGEYATISTSADLKDSATNARFIGAVAQSNREVQSLRRGFTKMANFISRSSAQLRQEDLRLSSIIGAGNKRSR